MKGIVSFSIGLIGLILCLFLVDNEPKMTIFKIALGFIVGGIIEFIVFIIENRNRWNVMKTLVLKRSKPVRVTIAYLFRIEVNGKYVLIKRHKQDNPGYQPIGGAYKYLKEENRELFDKLRVEPCHFVPRDEDTENDLRMIIKKRKNLIKFLRWFESRKNRELDPFREFYEELVEPEYLSKDIFRHIKYVFIRKYVEGVLKSPVYPIDELRYAEIFELRIEDDAQKKEIMNLLNFKDEILFATPDEIRNRVSHDGKAILSHSIKILP